MNKYICVAPSKEQFNVHGESLGMQGERALYYLSDIGRHRIYRSLYPKKPFFFHGEEINRKLKLLKYSSLKYAQKICDEINNTYGDNFKPIVIEESKTGAMLNPICQECSKKNTCNNKTLCAYLKKKEIKPQKSLVDAIQKSIEDIVITPEMVEKQLRKQLIEKTMGLDNASLMELRR